MYITCVGSGQKGALASKTVIAEKISIFFQRCRVRSSPLKMPNVGTALKFRKKKNNICCRDFFVHRNTSHKEISCSDLKGRVKKCPRKCMYKTVVLFIKPTAVSTFSILSFKHKLPKRVTGGVANKKIQFKIRFLGLITIIKTCHKNMTKNILHLI